MSIQDVTTYRMPPVRETIVLHDVEMVTDGVKPDGARWQLYRLRDIRGTEFYTFDPIEIYDYEPGARYTIEWILYANRMRMIAEIEE